MQDVLTASLTRQAPPPVILLTERPGIGKSTTMGQVVNVLEDRAGGFYTREVRAGRRRTGFGLVTLDGKTAPMATRDRDITFDRPSPFGHYRVNLDAIDALGVPALLSVLDQGRADGDPVAAFPRCDPQHTGGRGCRCWHEASEIADGQIADRRVLESV